MHMIGGFRAMPSMGARVVAINRAGRPESVPLTARGVRKSGARDRAAIGVSLEEAVMLDADLKKLAPDAVRKLHRC